MRFIFHPIHNSVKLILMLVLIISSFSTTNAQQIFDLKKCIETAHKNSIAIQQAQLNNNSRQIQIKNTELARYPNLTANGSNNYSFGRTIDPFSNTFINRRITSVNMNLSSNIRLFKGFQFTHDMKAARVSALQSNTDIDKAKNDVALNITALYLQVLMAKEQLKIAESNKQSTEKELERILILIDAGSATRNKEYELKAQLANDKNGITQAQNTIDLAYMSLRNFMNLDLQTEFEIQDVSINEISNLYQNSDLKEVVQNAYNFLPELKSVSYGLEAAQHQLHSAYAERSPTLTLGANLNTLYSSQSRVAENPTDVNIPIGIVENTNQTVFGSITQYDYSTPNLFNQFNNNFGQTIGLNLSIPIFTRNLINSGIQNAEINYQAQELSLQSIKNEIRNQIYESFVNMNNSYNSYLANQELIKSQQLLFNQTDIQYKAGVIGYFDWLQVRNNLNNTQIELLRSKFDYYFKQKVFEFYLGKNISL